MTEAPSIQWFPGHMAKTRRLMRESLRLVDIVVEVIDARIPISSRNPELPGLVGQKPRIVLLNKCDAADDTVTRDWCAYYKEQGIFAIPTDCRSGKGIKQFVPTVKEVLRPLLERRAQKGMQGAPIRMMVVGIPNVGKSSFINRMAGSRRTKVEDRPGVTRGRQWVNLDNGIDLLDMPGILWPKFEDKRVGEYLAFTGAVKDDVVDIELLAMRLLELLNERYHKVLCERYKLTDAETSNTEAHDLLALVARKRGMLQSGGTVHTERAAITVLDEFRSGKIGKITLETPQKPPKRERPQPSLQEEN
ncbi:MAG: ribosome biogenesis GTPase YlqF [Oscillospiraceae bacterium]|nr:ribosome biogenesis GTPase YlqF [Oscillospiraceae bacterium]